MPTFDETLAQVIELLQREGRVAYRVLKRRFALDDEYLEDLKADLIDAKRVAVDEDGKVLVWTGKDTAAGQVHAGKAAREQRTEEHASIQTRDVRLGYARTDSAERRQLTVLFCDLVGSTALAEQLDPEELREVVRGYQQVCADVIDRWEGHIAQHLGDGLLVYFGYPVAHEDDAQRTIRSGLEILAELRRLNTPLLSPLHVRIGMHTGIAVVGEVGGGAKREQLALGETPNIAARLQAEAAPDTVLISAATYRLVEGLFECEECGPLTLKGLSVPVQVYRVRKEGIAQSRFEATLRHGLTPLVGRTHELELLLERWERATDGEGQVVVLSGESGIGKSRLVQEFKEKIGREGITSLELRCLPYYQHTALYPVSTHLQQAFFAQEDTPQEKLQKLRQALAQSHFPQADTLPLLATLLSLPQPADSPPLTLSPQRQKQKTQEALVAWLLEEAERSPVYCVWEDLHWIDPSSFELLTLLIDQIPTARLYLLLTARPEFVSPWGARSHLSQLILSRLGRNQVSQLVERVTGGKALPSTVVQQIVQKTDGVPLFVEELTKTVLESGLLREAEGHYELTGPLPSLAIPATLQDSLMARLDRLATAKEVAQLGAAIGREFSYELLRAVAVATDAELQPALAKLVAAEVLYQRRLPPQAHYLFKHALIQDAAYQSLLKSTRQQYHQQIAQVLVERFAEITETQPELLAHHYTEAGLIQQALPYWQRAGERATQRSANVEAVTHLTKALELLKALPHTPERTQQELALHIVLGVPLVVTKGHAAPEVEMIYARAHELCQQVGETPQLFSALLGLRRFYTARGELRTAQGLEERLLTLARNRDDADFLPRAHMMLAETSLALGEFGQAQGHAEQGIALYDPQLHASHPSLYGNDTRVGCLCYAALALWTLGYPDQALKRLQEALTFAQELAHPFSVAMASMSAALLYQLRREPQEVKKWAEATMALAAAQGFVLYSAWGTSLHGWALAELGQRKEGMAQIRQGLDAYQRMGGEILRPSFLALLAKAYGKEGQTEEALALLAEAFHGEDHTGERLYEADLYRLKGELTLRSKVQSPRPKAEEEAEECFHKAIEIARRQRAKSWELRATTSLARLWQQQGKKAEARQMLAEIYGWFTEGFDTKDLQEARALLEELH
jgi:class 3 adenylate cyclase/predicted ATPase